MKGNRKSERVKELLVVATTAIVHGRRYPSSGSNDRMRWPAISLFISSFSFFLSFFLSLYSILAENFICWSNFLFFELLLLLLLDFKRFHPNLPRISEEDQHWIGQPKAIDRFLLFLSAGRMAKHPPATERSTERERETHTHTHRLLERLQILFKLIYSWECSPRRLPKESTQHLRPSAHFHFIFCSLSLSLFFPFSFFCFTYFHMYLYFLFYFPIWFLPSTWHLNGSAPKTADKLVLFWINGWK